jgi:hypothetical protein
MQATADDFKRHYASLSDETLLGENRDELVEVARRCLDEELARRGLAPRVNATAAAEPPSTDPGDQMVSAAEFTNPDEADLARALLESAGIPCFLANEHTAYKFNISNDFSGLPLLVPARLLDQAREILEAKVSDEELTAQAEASVEEAPVDDRAQEPEV